MKHNYYLTSTKLHEISNIFMNIDSTTTPEFTFHRVTTVIDGPEGNRTAYRCILDDLVGEFFKIGHNRYIRPKKLVPSWALEVIIAANHYGVKLPYPLKRKLLYAISDYASGEEVLHNEELYFFVLVRTKDFLCRMTPWELDTYFSGHQTQVCDDEVNQTERTPASFVFPHSLCIGREYPRETSFENIRINNMRQDQTRLNTETYQKGVTTLDDISHIFIDNPDDPEFDFSSDNGNAFGIGANRQAYRCIIDEIISNFFTIKGFYMIPSDSVPIWFARILLIGIKIGIKLPYHFRPAMLLELSSNRDTESVMSVLERYDPELYQKISKVTDEEISDLTLGEFNSIYSYLCDKLARDLEPGEKKLSDYFFQYGLDLLFYEPNEVDRYLSGEYVYTSELVKPMFDVDEEWRDTWYQMIDLMDHDELRKLLMIVGNTLDSNKTYYLQVDTINPLSIKVEVCFSQVKIGKFCLEMEPSELKKLVLSIEDDQIADKHRPTFEREIYEENYLQEGESENSIVIRENFAERRSEYELYRIREDLYRIQRENEIHVDSVRNQMEHDIQRDSYMNRMVSPVTHIHINWITPFNRALQWDTPIGRALRWGIQMEPFVPQRSIPRMDMDLIRSWTQGIIERYSGPIRPIIHRRVTKKSIKEMNDRIRHRERVPKKRTKQPKIRVHSRYHQNRCNPRRMHLLKQ